MSDFKIDKIDYTINGDGGVTAASDNYPSVSGIVIPEVIEHEQKKYKVTSIGRLGHCNNITIPSSVISIAELYTCENINRLLKDDGYLIITCLDAHRVEKVLKDNDGKYDQFLTINNEKIPFHSIHKMFDEYQKVYKYGNKINVKVSTFMNDYIPEYLVDDNFIIPELNKKCNLQLIETDYYENIYDNMKDYILNMKDVEEKEGMRRFLQNKISKFYETSENLDECKKVSFLNRYYVFKKISK